MTHFVLFIPFVHVDKAFMLTVRGQLHTLTAFYSCMVIKMFVHVYKFYCQLWLSLIASYSIANNCNIIIKAQLLTKVLLHHTHLHIISMPELQILTLISRLIYIVHYYLHNFFLCLLTCLPVFPVLTMGEAGHKSSLREGDSALKCPPNMASSMISSSETTWWSSAFSVQMLFTTWWR